MEMGLDKVDLEWGAQHCAGVSGDGDGDSESESDSSGSSGTSGSSGGASSSSSSSRVAQGPKAAAAGQVESGAADGHGEGANQAGQCTAAGSGGDNDGEAVMLCEGGVDAAAAAASAVVYANATALPCELDKAVGALPIPVIRTKQLAAQVKRMLKAAQRAFKASLKV